VVVKPRVDLRKVRDVKAGEMLIRFVLGATVSVVAAIISLAAGARLGGVFLAFPAILPASLTFVQDKEGTNKADRDAVGAVLGGLALLAFAAVGESMFGRHNGALVLVAALAAWLVSIAILYVAALLLRPDEET
jgi:uncharacterized membrane protein (GlpM family)